MGSLEGQKQITIRVQVGDESKKLQHRFHRAIPGGSHTYAKGDDQFPEGQPIYVTHGRGCKVWDVEGNEYIEYAMGLRSVTLGHAFGPVVEAAKGQLELGSNFNRPAPIEVECAEALLNLVPGAEMVKFAKNGSDVVDAAIKLARAHTGRDKIAFCGDHPFFSCGDWFIGTTEMNAGVPRAVAELSLRFRYNDLESVSELFRNHHGQIAALLLETEKEIPPAEGFLAGLRELCDREGTLLILDEMITGFRWHNGGAQTFYDVSPDLSTFGKAMGNGFSVSALAGRREIMELGGLDQRRRPRVFLLSTTHGAETHALAAARAVMQIYETEPVIQTLWQQGQRLLAGIAEIISELDLGEYFQVVGKPCCLVYSTRDADRQPSQAFRTLFLQELIRHGIIAPSFVVSYSHTDEDIDRTVTAIRAALLIYRQALTEGVEKYLCGAPVRPVFRKYN